MDNIDLNDERYALAGVVDHFEGKLAIISTTDGQTIGWPISQLPADCEVGASVRIILTTAESDQQEREKIAKSILNQILKETNNKNNKNGE